MFGIVLKGFLLFSTFAKTGLVALHLQSGQTESATENKTRRERKENIKKKGRR